MITVDKERCKRDGICAAECPMGIIRLKDQEGYPQMIPGGEQACIECGHCVAVCPQGALTHMRVPLEACPPILRELTVTHDEAVQFLRSRRSIRVFDDRSVEEDKIRTLIEIARYAPSASNAQPVCWTVFTDRARLKELSRITVEWMRRVIEKGPPPNLAGYLPLVVAAWDAGYDSVLRNAPVLILASAPAEATNGLVDVTLALAYLDLVAPTLDLGTCWAGLLQGALLWWRPLKEAVGLPEGHSHHYPMMLGYPKYKYYRLPERNPPHIVWR